MKTTSPHILLVNPWIHDFAAYDVWAKPLGLLGLAALLREHGFRVTYYDCLNRHHHQAEGGSTATRYGRGPYIKTELPKPAGLEDVPRRYCRYGVKKEWFKEDLETMQRPDLVMITTIMTYWYPGVRETIRILRARWPRVTVILGGVYATLCREHAIENSGADLVISGFTGPEIVNIAADQTGHSASARIRPDDLDAHPFPAFDLQHRIPYAALLTSVGCPYNCAYCASSLLNPAGRWVQSPDRVVSEILHWHEKYGVSDFAFYDDALLVDAECHAVPLLERLSRLSKGIRFHTPNALHIREITPRIARLMHRAGFRTVRLGLETTGPRDLDNKTTQKEFEAAAAALALAGFGAKELGAYLLVGLPDQSMEQIEASIRIVKGAGVKPIPAYYTPIPHTRLWKNAVRASRYDLETDPVFTNNAVLPCWTDGFSWEIAHRLKRLIAQ